jgi:hypothetical protein
MADFTHRIRAATFSGAGESLGGATSTIAGSTEVKVSESIAAGASNAAVTLALDVSAMKDAWLLADGDLTVGVVSADSPNPEIELKANVPFYWIAASGDANPFGVSDVTGLLVTNTDGSVAVQLDVRALVDATP